MTRWCTAAAAVLLLALAPARAAEPDHAIHEELRALLRTLEAAMAEGAYDRMLPLLDERIAATSITQEVMGSRAEVANYFRAWFGPSAYMKSMRMTLEADALTALAPDKSWGLVRGSALEQYVANEGYVFDFRTRWSAVVAKGDDGRWRLRAIHFGTSPLDNPVLTRVRRELTRVAWIAGAAALAIGLAAGVLLGRRGRRAVA